MRTIVIRRVLQGLWANVYGQVVVVVVQLATVPILLSYWGREVYGEWLILFAIPAYLSITDLGFSQSAGNDMTARVARGDWSGALAVFQSLGGLVCLAAGAGLVLCAGLVELLPVGRWMHFSVLTGDDVRMVILLLASEVLVKIIDGAVHAGFRANGQYAFHYAAYSTILLCQHAALWLVAILGYGPVLAALAFASIRWFATPILAAVMFHRYRWLTPGFRHARLHELRRLTRPALANIAFPVSQAIDIYGTVLVIGSILGPISVVIFSTLRTLTRFPLRLSWGVSRAIEPEFAAAWGAQDEVLLKRLYLHGLGASFWAALALTVLLLCTGQKILTFWTHGRVDMNFALFVWLQGAAITGVLWNSSLMLLRSANVHLPAALWGVFSSLLALGLAALLLQATGKISDVGPALLVAEGAMALYLLRLAGNFIGVTTSQLLLNALDPLPLLRSIVAGFGYAR